MNVIRSNPWGFGIHSPFVYHLVTRVLYGPWDPVPEEVTLNPVPSSRDKRTLRQILRLISHFKPGKVVLEVGNDEIIRNIRVLLTGKEIISSAELPQKMTGWGSILVIAGSSRFFPAEIPGSQDQAVWILRQLKNFEMRSLFNKLRNSEKVSLTIEVNNTGIIIFNPNFRKQNYVIKRYYCF